MPARPIHRCIPGLAIVALLLGGGCGKSAPGGGGAGGKGPTKPAAQGSIGGGGTEPASVAPWFADVTDDLGIDFVRGHGGDGSFHMPEIMGGGVALFDGDGDGDLDLYLTDAADTLPGTEPSATLRNRYYRQEADGSFTDATDASGLGDGGYGMGVATGDVDNDGDVDVFVANYGPSRLFRNRGDGTFERDDAALEVDGWASSAAFVDYDGDGWLDLYVCRYVQFHPDKTCRAPTGKPDYCGPKEYPPSTDVLLRNRGDGTFEDVSAASGIDGAAGAGLGVVCADFDEDGHVDFFVANDGDANHFWHNAGDGTFQERAMLAGAALNNMGVAEAGMGIVAADFDADGRLDLFLTHLGRESNTLYLNEGGGLFRDASATSGLGPSSVPFTGFGTVAFDADLDGAVDLFIGNGRVSSDPVLDGAQPAPPFDRYAEPNLFYRNLGDGRFESLGAETSALCAPIEITRGVAAGDLDRDGDLDLVLVNIGGRARVYRNDAPRRGRGVAVRVLEPALGREAVAAEVRLHTSAGEQVRMTGGGFSYLSSNETTAHFGLREGVAIEEIEVRYADGGRERFDAAPDDGAITVRRNEGRTVTDR